MNLWQKISLTVALIASSLSLASVQQIDPSRVRAYFVYPLSLEKGSRGSWIEIMGCSRVDDDCTTLIDRIRLADLKQMAALTVKIDPVGFLSLALKQNENKENEIVKAEYADGWFARTELCRSAQSPLGCDYRIFRNDVIHALTLKVQAGK
jgi:hypothetical protein